MAQEISYSTPHPLTLPRDTFFGMAAGVALINCVGGLGGFVSPYVVGLIKDITGSTDYGVFFISAMALIGVGLTLLVPKRLVNR